MEDFAKIIEEKVQEIDLQLRVTSQQGNKLFVCRTLFLTPKYEVQDTQGNEYKVTDFLNNEWIEVTPIGEAPDPFNDDFVICPDVFYMHGTPRSVNDEYDSIRVDTKEKTPMIWLNENYRERPGGRESSIEREVTPQLFFLEETNEEDWNNGEHHRLAIQPMSNLVDEFLKTFKNDRRFKRLDFIEKVPRPRFGVYVNEQGNTDKIIDEDFSAVEVQPTLIKYKESCKCY